MWNVLCVGWIHHVSGEASDIVYALAVIVEAAAIRYGIWDYREIIIINTIYFASFLLFVNGWPLSVFNGCDGHYQNYEDRNRSKSATWFNSYKA